MSKFVPDPERVRRARELEARLTPLSRAIRKILYRELDLPVSDGRSEERLVAFLWTEDGQKMSAARYHFARHDLRSAAAAAVSAVRSELGVDMEFDIVDMTINEWFLSVQS